MTTSTVPSSASFGFAPRRFWKVQCQVVFAAGPGSPTQLFARRYLSGSVSVPVGATLAEAERDLIRATLAREGGNKSRAADILGIGRKTLHRKLQEYGLGQQ